MAVLGILAVVATPRYQAWRADVMNNEATMVMQEALSGLRSDARRRATTVSVNLHSGDTSVLGARGRVNLPHGAQLVTTSPITLAFEGSVGAMQPFQVVRIGVRTGTGSNLRERTLTIIPPLGTMVVNP